MEYKIGTSFINPIVINGKIALEFTGLAGQIAFHHLQRNRKFFFQPLSFGGVNRNMGEIGMPADMIPVHMGCSHGNGQSGETVHHLFYIRNAQSRINQKGSL